jgi:hypothetical protein
LSEDQRNLIRPSVAALALLLALGMAGCGGDDETTAPQAGTPGPTTATETEQTETVAVPPDTGERTQTSTSPEDQPGGAGDEEPARSQALFSGRGGRIKPALVRVPAYIAIRVELRSADGKTYSLRFGNRTLRVDGTVGSRTADFSGIRPGGALIGQPVGGGNRVRIEATAEPGP